MAARHGGEEVLAEAWQLYPVPPADGPKLAPRALVAPVYGRPDKSGDPIGYLRLGAKIARSADPVGTTDCARGWYSIFPVGFACAQEDFTASLDEPLVRAVGVEPERSRALPYPYAFVRSVAPNYLRIPTREEQFRSEMRLERHLRNYEKLARQWDALHPGANAVPLDERGLALGPIPKGTRALDMSARFGGDGRDVTPWWLVGKRHIPNVSGFVAPDYAVMADRIKRHAGVAVMGVVNGGEQAGFRRFAITTDLRLIPADKLKADSGSAFHGIPLDGALPVGFVLGAEAKWFDERGAPLMGVPSLRHREGVALSEESGESFVQARGGGWLKQRDLRVVRAPKTLPSFALRGRRWIDVSLLSQSLVLWEGDRPVYATLVSTGRDGLRDSSKALSTPVGTFRIYEKHVTTRMSSDVADQEFELRDVPWVMYFKGGYALHGTYWHDDFGTPRSHGCVNLSPVDAHYVFNWTQPEVPEHWHASYAGDAFGEGTIVHIHL